MYYIATLPERQHGCWDPEVIRRSDTGPLDPFSFVIGAPYEGPRPLAVSRPGKGRACDWWWCAMMTPLVREPVAAALDSRFGSDIQFIPVEVPGSVERFLILNVTTRGDFLDTQRSGISYKNPHDRDTPQERYWSVGPLVIDDRKARGHHLFRIRGWEAPLILSQAARSVLEAMNVEDVGFLPASLPDASPCGSGG